MIDYRAGSFGFHVAFGWKGSLAPRSLAMAIPNAVVTAILSLWIRNVDIEIDKSSADVAKMIIGAFSVVMLFVLQNRSRTSYSRWWEGGTLLQKARGEWFNAYSSIMAFTSSKPELHDEVEAYVHLTARLMSLLMCCALQQVSPNRDRPFEIIDLEGIDPASLDFLNSAHDKVEIILQWIQRSMVLHMQTGVLPVAPPILSRAFQEVSRGIVNLQNARKIADFPYPFPLAQLSMILQLAHWAATPIFSALALPTAWAILFSFISIFVLWCIHFNALDLEFPFGSRENDLPLLELQQDWNKSICILIHRQAHWPPAFDYDPHVHDDLALVMSDGSDPPEPESDNLPRRTVIARGLPNSNRKTMSRVTTKVDDDHRCVRYSVAVANGHSTTAMKDCIARKSVLSNSDGKSCSMRADKTYCSAPTFASISEEQPSIRESDYEERENTSVKFSADVCIHSVPDMSSCASAPHLVSRSNRCHPSVEDIHPMVSGDEHEKVAPASELTVFTVSPSARFQASSVQSNGRYTTGALPTPIGIQPLDLTAIPTPPSRTNGIRH